MKWLPIAVLCLAMTGTFEAAAADATPGKNSAQLTAEQRSMALQSIEKNFHDRYVFPELRAKIIARLEQERHSGRYDVNDPAVFSSRITEDLQDVAHDKHLSLRVAPDAYAAAMAPAASHEGTDARELQQAIREHHGLSELRLLPGNIRYLRITGFEWIDDVTGAAYDDALRFLKDGDAVIIDLRGNGGGSHAAVRYLVSHFLAPETLELTFLAADKPPEQSRTLNQLPAGRLIGKPLYVLIDANVASGAEAFAYDVKQFKLGELIGAKTVGAANNNTLLPIAPDFMLSISYGRPVHAVSQSNWEGVGVMPDVEVPPLSALDVAQARALDRLLKAPGISEPTRIEYHWASTAVEAKLHPVTLSADELRPLQGTYGKYVVEMRDGTLWLIWPKRSDFLLQALDAHGLFAIAGREDFRIRLTGKALEILWADDPTPKITARD